MGHRLAFSLVTDPGGPGGPAAGPSCMCDTQAPSSLSHVPPGDGHTHRAARHKSSAQKCPHRTTLVSAPSPTSKKCLKYL